MFSGLLYCADCGAKLNYNAISNGDRSRAHFICSAYRKDTVNCTAHYIREKVVYDVVLKNLQRVLWYVQAYDREFARLQIEQHGIEQRKELIKKEKDLTKAKNRVNEIEELLLIVLR